MKDSDFWYRKDVEIITAIVLLPLWLPIAGLYAIDALVNKTKPKSR